MFFRLTLLSLYFVSALSNINQLFDQLCQLPSFGDDSIIVILGVTGTGKSALSNLLGDYDLKERWDYNRGKYTYELKGVEPGASPIGQTLSSKTLFPFNVISRLDKNRQIIDTPGTEQNRGILHQLFSAYAVDYIFRNSSRLITIVAIEQQSLTTSRRDLQDVLLSLREHDDCSLSVGIVITKVESSPQELDRLLANKVAELANKKTRGSDLFECVVALGHYAPFYTPESLRKLGISYKDQIKILNKLLSKLQYTGKNYNFSGIPKQSYGYLKQVQTLAKQFEQLKTTLIVRFSSILLDHIGYDNSLRRYLKQLNQEASYGKYSERIVILQRIPALQKLVKQLRRFDDLLSFVGSQWAQTMRQEFFMDLRDNIREVYSLGS